MCTDDRAGRAGRAGLSADATGGVSAAYRIHAAQRTTGGAPPAGLLPGHPRGDVVVLARWQGPRVSSEKGNRDRPGGTAGGGRETHATPRTPLSRRPLCGSVVAADAPSSSIRTGGRAGCVAGPARGGWISPVKSLAGRRRPSGPVRRAVAAAARDGEECPTWGGGVASLARPLHHARPTTRPRPDARLHCVGLATPRDRYQADERT